MEAINDGHGWILAAVDCYELPLMRYARRLLGDVDLAADAVQHAFVQLCGESRATVGDHLSPWLFRVCRNKAFDHLRQHGREQPFLDDAAADAAATPVGRAADARDHDPADTVADRDLAGHLRELLHDLPGPQREAIDLWCEGLTYREIAVVTGRTEGHIRVLAHRGLTTLRRHPAIRSLLPSSTPARERVKPEALTAHD